MTLVKSPQYDVECGNLDAHSLATCLTGSLQRVRRRLLRLGEPLGGRHEPEGTGESERRGDRREDRLPFRPAHGTLL